MTRFGLIAALAPLAVLVACGGGRTAPGALAAKPVLLPVPGDPTIACSVSFRAGSQDDPAGKEGLAYITATMMAEGATSAHAYPEILRLLYPMASSYRVRVDKERITFTGRTHRDNTGPFTDLFLDAVLRPAFTADDLHRIRERTLSYLEKTLRYSSDEDLGKAALYNTVFAGTPYGHLDEGTVEGLAAITLEDVKSFYAKHFTRDTVLLGLGGGYQGELVSRMEQALATLPAGAPPEAPAPRPAAIHGRQVVIVSKPGPATAISLGFPLPVHRGDRDFYALWVANSWLGEHRNSASHLYQVIREARGMNYGDYSYLEAFPEGGSRQMPPPNVPRRRQIFEVWIRPVPGGQARFALRAAVRELEKLAADGLTQEQFDLTQRFLLKYSLHFADTTAARLGYAVDDRFYGIPEPGHLARFREVVASLTRDEVNAAVRKYLAPDNVVIAMVGEDGPKLADALAAGAPSPITYATPKPPEVLEEDKVIAAYPLRIERANVKVVPVEEMFLR